MNLRVDLILETERRSPSVLSVKALVRIALVVGPLLVLLLIGLGVMSSTRDKAAFRRIQAQWSTLEPKKKPAEKLKAEANKNMEVWKAMDGWTVSRVNFSEHLVALMQQVPEQMQLTALNISQEMKPLEKGLARIYTLTLEGRSLGTNAEANIYLLESRIKTVPPFSGNMTKVEFQGWPDNSPTATKGDLIFRGNCVYAPRYFDR